MIDALIYLHLMACLLLHAFADAVQDAIKDRRTHLAQHPYKDGWHLAKHISRFALLMAGWGIAFGVLFSPPATLIVAAAGLVIGRKVWDVTYKQPERWLALDERLKLSTGVKWLDKWLGFHN